MPIRRIFYACLEVSFIIVKPFIWSTDINFKKRKTTNYIVIHHSDSGDVSAQTIHGWHLKKRYLGIGYAYVIRANGDIEGGRPDWAEGAHVYGKNDVSIGICLAGDFEEYAPTSQQISALAKLCKSLLTVYKDATIVRHEDLAATKCPGKYFPWEEFLSNVKKGEFSMDGKFKDLANCWYPELALKAVEEGIISGYDDGTLRPREQVDREQLWLVALRQRQVENHLLDIPVMVKKYMPSIVRIWSENIKGSSVVGSGSFIAPNLILTNAHVVCERQFVSVDTFDHYQDNSKIQGEVIKKDKNIDLALVKIDSSKYTPIKLASGAIHGEFCLVLGNPGGEWQSVTFGIVSHNDRGWYIETDARVNPGNSGGAVINAKGELIGVPSHKIALDHSWDNQNYAIRTSIVKEFIQGVV